MSDNPWWSNFDEEPKKDKDGGYKPYSFYQDFVDGTKEVLKAEPLKTDLPARADQFTYPEDAPGRGVGNAVLPEARPVPEPMVLPTPTKSPSGLRVTPSSFAVEKALAEKELLLPSDNLAQPEVGFDPLQYVRDVTKYVADKSPSVPGVAGKPTASQLAFYRQKLRKQDYEQKKRQDFIREFESRNPELAVDRPVLEAKLPARGMKSTWTPDLQQRLESFTSGGMKERKAEDLIVRDVIDRASPEQIEAAYDAQVDATQSPGSAMVGTTMLPSWLVGSKDDFKYLADSREERLQKAREFLKSKGDALNQGALSELGVGGEKAVQKATEEGVSLASVGTPELGPADIDYYTTKLNPGFAVLGAGQEIADIIAGRPSQVRQLGTSGMAQVGRTLVNLFAAPEGEKSGLYRIEEAAIDRFKDPGKLARDMKLMRLPGSDEETRAPENWIATGLSELPRDLVQLLTAPFMMAYELGGGLASPAKTEDKVDKFAKVVADMGHMIVESGVDFKSGFAKGPATQALNFYLLTGGPMLSRMKKRIEEQRYRLENQRDKGVAAAAEELAKLDEIDVAIEQAQAGLDAAIQKQMNYEQSLPYAKSGAELAKEARKTSKDIKGVVKALDRQVRKRSEKATETLRRSEAERGVYVADEPGRILGKTEAGFTPRAGRVERFRKAREAERVSGKQATEVSAAVAALRNSLVGFDKVNNRVVRTQQAIEAIAQRTKKKEIDRINKQIDKLDRKREYDDFQRRQPEVELLESEAANRKYETERQRLVDMRDAFESAPVIDKSGRYASLVGELDSLIAQRSNLRTELMLDYRALNSLVSRGGAQFLMDAPSAAPAAAPARARRQRVGPKQEADVVELLGALAKTDEAVFGGELGQRARYIDKRVAEYQAALRENAIREIRVKEADGTISPEWAEQYIRVAENTKYPAPEAVVRKIALDAEKQFTRPEVGAPDRKALGRFIEGSTADVKSIVGESLKSGRAAASSARKAQTQARRTKKEMHDREFKLRKKERLARLELEQAAGPVFELKGKYRAKVREAQDIAAKAPDIVYPDTPDFPGKKRPEPWQRDPVLEAGALVAESGVAEAMMNPANSKQVTSMLDAIASKADTTLKTSRVEPKPYMVDGKYPATKIETMAYDLMDMAETIEANKADIAAKLSEQQAQRDVVSAMLDANKRIEDNIRSVSGDPKIPKSLAEAKEMAKKAATDPVSELGLTILAEAPRLVLGASILSPFEIGSQAIKMMTASKGSPRLRYYLRNPSERLSEWYRDIVKEAELNRSKAEFQLNKALEYMPNEVKPTVSQWMNMQHEAANRMPTGEPFYGANPDRNLVTYMDTPGYSGYHETPYGRQVAGKSAANAAHLAEHIVAMNETARPLLDISRDYTKQAVEQGLFTDPSSLRPLWWAEKYDPKVVKKMSEKIDSMFEQAARDFKEMAPELNEWLQQRKSVEYEKGIFEKVATKIEETIRPEGAAPEYNASALNANMLRRAAERWQRLEDARVADLASKGQKAEPRQNPFSIEQRELVGLITDLDVAAKTGVADMIQTIESFKMYEQLSIGKDGTTISGRQYKALEQAANDGRINPKIKDEYVDVREALERGDKKAVSPWLSSEKKVPKYGLLTGIKTVDPKTGKTTWRLREGNERLFMRADDLYEMVAAQRLQEQLKGLFPKVLTNWKIFQTAGSPMTFYRNLWTNAMMFAPMANNSPLNPGNWPYYAKALADSFLPKGRRSKDWQIGYENGAYRNTYTQEELRVLNGAMAPMQGGFRNGADFIKSWLMAPLRIPLETGKAAYTAVKSPSAKTVKAVPGAVMSETLKPLADTGNLLGKMYSWGDDVFRSAYINKQLDVYRKSKRQKMLSELDRQREMGSIDLSYFAKQEPGLAGYVNSKLTDKSRTTESVYSAVKEAIGKTETTVPKRIQARIAKDAENKFVNYSDVSGVVQVLRAPVEPMALGGGARALAGAAYYLAGQPFISFAAKATPQWMGWYANNPWKASLYHNIGSAITQANKIEAGKDEGQQGQLEAAVKMLPASQGGGYVPLAYAFPGLAKELEPVYETALGNQRDRILVDARWLIPIGGYLPDIDLMANAMQAPMAVLSKMAHASGDPFISALGGVFTNRDPYSGMPIFDTRSSTDPEKTRTDISNYLMKGFAPPLAPSPTDLYDMFTGGSTAPEKRIEAGRQVETVLRAQKGERDYKGRRLSPTEALLQMGGFKAQKMLPSIAVSRFNRSFANEFDQARRGFLPETLEKEFVSFSEDQLAEMDVTRPAEAKQIRDAERRAAKAMFNRAMQQVKLLEPFARGGLEGEQLLAEARAYLDQYMLFTVSAMKPGSGQTEAEDTAVYYLKEAIKSLNKFNQLDREIRGLSRAPEGDSPISFEGLIEQGLKASQ